MYNTASNRSGIITNYFNNQSLFNFFIFLIIFSAFFRLIYAHIQQLNLKPHYQFYPVIFLGAIILIWPVLNIKNQAYKGSPIFGILFAIISWLILSLGIFFYSATLGMVSLILLIMSMPITLGGIRMVHKCMPAFILLLFTIPLPFGLDEHLVRALQRLASNIGSSLLDLTGIYHNVRGNVLEVSGKKYFVEEACSGANSLMSVLACTLFYVLYNQVSIIRSAILILSAIFWVVIANIVRVYSITILDSKFAIDLTSGWPHELFGIIIFGITLSLLWSTDRLILFFLKTDTNVNTNKYFQKSELAAVFESLSSFTKSWYSSPYFVIAFGLLLVIQIYERIMTFSMAPFSGSELSKFYDTIQVSSLPLNYGKWKQMTHLFGTRDSENLYGEFSKTWRYTYNQQRSAILSLDYPFPEWHDLRVCYKNNGWIICESTQHDVEPSMNDTGLHFLRVRLSNLLGKEGIIWFTNFNQDGYPIKPDVLKQQIEPSSLLERIQSRFATEADHWFKIFRSDRVIGREGSILQVQLFTESFQPLSDDDLKQFEDFFIFSADRLRKICIELKNSKKS